MLSLMLARRFRRLHKRQLLVRQTRNDTALSPEMSVRTLTHAPAIWQQRHQAFTYIDRQDRRLQRSLLRTSGWLAASVLIDVAVLALGFSAVQSVHRWSIARSTSSYRAVAADIYHSDLTGNILDPLWSAEQQLLLGAPEAQLMAVKFLSVAEYPQAISLLTKATEPEFPYEVRLEAVKVLGRISDARLLALQPLLSDPDPTIRTQAAAGVAALSQTKAVVKHRGTELEMTWTRPEASVDPSETTAYPLAPFSSDREPRYAPTTDFPPAPNYVDLYRELEALQSNLVSGDRPNKLSGNEARRILILSKVTFLVSQTPTVALPELTALLSDDDELVQLASIEALVELGDRQAVEGLQQRLAVEPRVEVRQAMAQAIAQLDRPPLTIGDSL